MSSIGRRSPRGGHRTTFNRSGPPARVLRPGDAVYGWTWSPRIEDTYTHPDVGAKILVFLSKEYPHDILSYNAAPPDRLNKTSEELDAITHNGTLDVDAGSRWSGQ